MRLVPILLCVAGCDALFRLQPINDGEHTGDALDNDSMKDGCWNDSFDSLAGWNMYVQPGCNVQIINGEAALEIAPSTACYADLTAPMARVLTNATVTVKVVSVGVSASNVETFVDIRADSQTYVYFEVRNRDLRLGVVRGDAFEQETVMPYDPLTMVYWRFQQGPEVDAFALYTGTGAADGWTLRHTVRVPFSMIPLTLGLGTASYSTGVASGSIAKFDESSLCTP
jgi:hypothetical protein